ncbi:hypothetical protein HRbin17_00391 [bacterium HR17]|jgi:hypothetical protein|uniref:4Fe-4S ferredoxin-type domain-containing protein n=1 Tax=Candidatus Fervidibacter japonicus TaxID=2035412 RepID=A0A2H5X9N4_9BACT|nr:hypothetical protein HRbin17_00391 [bacterium HR17]
MAKGSGKHIALLLLLVLATFAAAEVAGVAEERGNSVPCSADGCGDCLCCMPPAVVSLKICQVAKADDSAKDIPAAVLPSLPTLSPLLGCELDDFETLPLCTLTPSFVLSPRAPPLSG